MNFADALSEAEAWIGSIDGVEDVAEGILNGAPCITVFVSSQDVFRLLPPRLGRWPVVAQGADARGSGSFKL